MSYFSIVLEQLIIFVIYMAIGVIAVKAKVLNREKLNVLSGCITKILLPLLIFSNTISGTTREEFVSSLSIVLIAAILYLLLYFVAAGLAKATKLKGDRENVYRACTMFGNCGFMGIPLITALYPEAGGIYIAMYTVIDQLSLWTVGMDLTEPEGGDQKLSPKQRVKKMINPATIAIVLGVIIVLTGIELPEVLTTALSKTGAAASPLAMVYLGGVFCYIRIFNTLKNKEIYLTAVVKMMILPVIVYAVLSRIPGIGQDISFAISVLCALPSMSSVAMMAEAQGSDSDYAAGMIFVTTMLSVITIPVVCLIIG